MSDLIERLERIPADLEWIEDKGSHRRLAIGEDVRKAAARIKELEAECQRLLAVSTELGDERDAIEAATIQKCIAECVCSSCAEYIRALAKPVLAEESK